MKVFFIANWFPNRSNPAEGMFLKNIAEAVSAYDDVTVFYADETPTVSSPLKEYRTENKAILRIVYYPSPRLSFKLLNALVSSLKRIYYLHRLIKEEFKAQRPDIFHFNIVSPSVVLMWYYKLVYRIPFIYSEHWDIPLRVKFGLVKKWLPWRVGMKLSSLFSSRVVVCSNAMENVFERYGLSSNVEVIPNVVSVNADKSAMEKQEGGKKIILHISSLDSLQKNVSGILQAISEVAAERNDFELHILGKGKELNELKEYAASLNILNSLVWFHGYVSEEEKVSWQRKSSFHLIFSNFEGHSVVTAESICYGKPVIATRCGGPEDFVNETNGVLIEPRNNKELVSAVKIMLDNYQQFNSDNLRKYGKELYSPETIGLKHHQLYQKITGKDFSKRTN